MKALRSSILPGLTAAFLFVGLAHGKMLDTVAPEEVGLSTERLARASGHLQRLVDDGKLAGIVALVARRGKIAYFESFGMMDVAANKPMRPDTIMRMNSMTKPLTATAVMMLYEEGHFQLRDPISKYLPALKNVKVLTGVTKEGVQLAEQEHEMTIWNLLTHTSGFSKGSHAENPDRPIDAMYRKAQLGAGTLEDFVEKLGGIPLLFQPGTKWSYGISMDVLGYLVEVISGQSVDDFLARRLFEPLGMKDTAFLVPEEKRARFAELYTRRKGGGIRSQKNKVLTYAGKPKLPRGGSGVVSTAMDYLRFCQMFLNGGELDGVRILGRKTVELMTMNLLRDEENPRFTDSGEGWGLGFSVLVDIARSPGPGSEGTYRWGGGSSTIFWVDPKEELVGIFLTQLIPADFRPAWAFKMLTYQAIID